MLYDKGKRKRRGLFRSDPRDGKGGSDLSIVSQGRGLARD